MKNLMRLFVVLFALSFTSHLAAQEQEATDPIPVFHPLDALTQEEVEAAAKILRDAKSF